MIHHSFKMNRWIHPSHATSSSSSSLYFSTNPHNNPFFNSLIIGNNDISSSSPMDVVTQAEFDQTFESIGEKVINALSNIAIGTVILIVALVGIATFFSAVIIPQAAEELEKQVKETYPELWEEYKDKLEPGETLSMRPDIMQELGNQLQRKSLDDFEQTQNSMMQQQQQQQGRKEFSSNKDEDLMDVTDVEIISKE